MQYNPFVDGNSDTAAKIARELLVEMSEPDYWTRTCKRMAGDLEIPATYLDVAHL